MRRQVDVAAKRPRMASMWPEPWEVLASVDESHQYDPQKVPQEELVTRERAFADPDHLFELVHSSETGVLQMAQLVGQWEKRQANAVHLLRQQLEALNMQRLEAERKYRSILASQWTPKTTGNVFPPKPETGEPICPMDEDDSSSSGVASSQGSSVGSLNSSVLDDMENSLDYWKDRAKRMGHLLAESLQREQVLLSKLEENGVQSAVSVPVEELQENLHRLDNFLHFTLRKAPLVLGHQTDPLMYLSALLQDVELRHKFIYNPFPGLTEEEILGKTDIEIHSGPGVEECMEFKKEVLKWGRPMQREIDFETDLFGHKIFIVTVEPVIGKSGETLGINYVALDITEEAARREKLVVLREEAAVQKTMETELQRTLVITDEAMRAKQILATMSHEIRSPLSGVVSMAQVLGTTKLDAEQRMMVDVMNASGEHVLELINDILDLSKAESGAMKFEGKKFRPRLVVKRVLQLALASVQNKNLNLVTTVADDVPEEVVGDVLRIRQVLTNLVSNAVKFTPKGEVSIKVRLASPSVGSKDCSLATTPAASQFKGATAQTQISTSEQESKEPAVAISENDSKAGAELSDISRSSSSTSSVSTLSTVSSTLSTSSSFSTKCVDDAKGEEEPGTPPTFPGVIWDLSPDVLEMTEEVWLHCEVCDTGIGIPEAALPSLFEVYTQVSTTTARKYGGTGLGLAICKQLVGLMGGTLEVKSKQYMGSTFSFTLPLRAVKEVASQGPLIDSDSSKRPSVLPRGSDVKGKNSKGVDRRLKQLLRDSKRSWISALGESPLFGHTKTPTEKVLPQVLLEEKISGLSNSDDITGSSSSQVSTVESSKPNQKCPLNPKPGSPTSALIKSNIPRSSASSLKNAIPAQSSAQTVTPASVQGEASTNRSPRILLAEDNNVNVVVAQTMLKRLGHSLEVVYNGAEAVEALHRSGYDLVLMDVSMPVMDGLEATRLIRKFEETGEGTPQDKSAPESSGLSSPTSCDISSAQHSDATPAARPSFRKRTPIIALTANAMAENVAECYHNGMDSFIAKPVTFEKLEQVLKQYIPWSKHHRVQSR